MFFIVGVGHVCCATFPDIMILESAQTIYLYDIMLLNMVSILIKPYYLFIEINIDHSIML